MKLWYKASQPPRFPNFEGGNASISVQMLLKVSCNESWFEQTSHPKVTPITHHPLPHFPPSIIKLMILVQTLE